MRTRSHRLGWLRHLLVFGGVWFLTSACINKNTNIGVESNACGDGEVTGSEKCDDGNEESGDGCASTCRKVESGFECPEGGGECMLVESFEPNAGTEDDDDDLASDPDAEDDFDAASDDESADGMPSNWCPLFEAMCPDEWDLEHWGPCGEFCGQGQPTSEAHDDCKFSYCSLREGYCDNEMDGDTSILTCVEELWPGTL